MGWPAYSSAAADAADAAEQPGVYHVNIVTGDVRGAGTQVSAQQRGSYFAGHMLCKLSNIRQLCSSVTGTGENPNGGHDWQHTRPCP